MLNLAVKFVKSIVNTSSSALDTIENGIVKGGKATDKWLDRKVQEVEDDLYVYEQSRDKARAEALAERLLEINSSMDKHIQKLNNIKSPALRESLAKEQVFSNYVTTSVDNNGNTVYKFK